MSKKLLSPKNDYIFERLFGHKGNEELTKGLLSAILNKKIKEVDLSQNEVLEKDLLTKKNRILDIRAKLDNNVDINIEMQVADYLDIEERALYYWSKLCNSILNHEKNHDDSNVVIMLITEDEVEKLKKINRVLTKWQIIEDDHPDEVLTDKVEFYILEFSKYKKYKNVNKELENWIKFIESPEKMNMSEIEDKNIKKAQEELEKISEDEHERELALKRETFLHEK